jgi:hypothetical protein
MTTSTSADTKRKDCRQRHADDGLARSRFRNGQMFDPDLVRPPEHQSPLWLRKATLPGRTMSRPNVAFSPIQGFINPRQFGPIRRAAPRLNSDWICRSNAIPSGPLSLKPAEITTTAFALAFTHSATTAGTVGAGVTTTTRSTASGTVPMVS